MNRLLWTDHGKQRFRERFTSAPRVTFNDLGVISQPDRLTPMGYEKTARIRRSGAVPLIHRALRALFILKPKKPGTFVVLTVIPFDERYARTA